MIYKCNDGNSLIEIEAGSAREAAQEYVDSGDWGHNDKTIYINVWVTDEDESTTRIKIVIDPIEPNCPDHVDHNWAAPYSIVGGCKESPGVWGSGGGVKYTEVCLNCGCGKHVNTWDYDSETGEVVESIKYCEDEFADEVAELQEEERN